MSKISVFKEHLLIDDVRRDIITYKVQLASEHKIEALSSNPHNWRGRQGHARIDEAAFHPNLIELVDGAIAYTMLGGRVDIVSTHLGSENPFNQLVEDVKKKRLPWSHHRVTFDDALRQGFYRRRCLIEGKKWSEEAEATYRAKTYSQYTSRANADQELGCIPVRGSGAYFTRMLLQSCMKDDIPVLRIAKPPEFVLDPGRLDVIDEWIKEHLKPIIDKMPNLRSVFGQDFGRDGDLSAVVPAQDHGAGQWVVPFLLEMRTLPFDCQWRIVQYLLDNLPLFHHASFDARGNGQEHAEKAMQHVGAQKVSQIKATPQFYAEWFPKYRAAWEDGSMVWPLSEDVIADHRLVYLDNGQPRMLPNKIKGSDGMQRHGDTAIAGLNMYHALSQEGEPAAGITIPPVPAVRRSSRGDKRLIARPRGGFAIERPRNV